MHNVLLTLCINITDEINRHAVSHETQRSYHVPDLPVIPFKGMEQEREILMAKYIPELSHLCQTKGVSLVPVDMRWGITADAADNAQVVSICLKELDRADIFVGLFAQVSFI